MVGNESRTIMRPFGIGAHNNQIGAPATRADGTAFFFCSPLHQLGSSVTFQDRPFSCLGRPPPSTSTAILHVNWAPPPLTHVSPLYRIVVSTPPIHCPSFRTFGWSGQGQSQQTARCQRGQHSLGVPPEQESVYRPAGDCHVISNPAELIYPSLCQGHEAHEPMLQRSFRAPPSD
jgi:hypothetical protein